MIVPITKGASPFADTGQQMPSEANLLMALTEMHKQGRFNQDDDDTKSTSNIVRLPKRQK